MNTTINFKHINYSKLKSTNHSANLYKRLININKNTKTNQEMLNKYKVYISHIIKTFINEKHMSSYKLARFLMGELSMEEIGLKNNEIILLKNAMELYTTSPEPYAKIEQYLRGNLKKKQGMKLSDDLEYSPEDTPHTQSNTPKLAPSKTYMEQELSNTLKELLCTGYFESNEKTKHKLECLQEVLDQNNEANSEIDQEVDDSTINLIHRLGNELTQKDKTLLYKKRKTINAIFELINVKNNSVKKIANYQFARFLMGKTSLSDLNLNSSTTKNHLNDSTINHKNNRITISPELAKIFNKLLLSGWSESQSKTINKINALEKFLKQNTLENTPSESENKLKNFLYTHKIIKNIENESDERIYNQALKAQNVVQKIRAGERTKLCDEDLKDLIFINFDNKTEIDLHDLNLQDCTFYAGKYKIHKGKNIIINGGIFEKIECNEELHILSIGQVTPSDDISSSTEKLSIEIRELSGAYDESSENYKKTSTEYDELLNYYRFKYARLIEGDYQIFKEFENLFDDNAKKFENLFDDNDQNFENFKKLFDVNEQIFDEFKKLFDNNDQNFENFKKLFDVNAKKFENLFYEAKTAYYKILYQYKDFIKQDILPVDHIIVQSISNATIETICGNLIIHKISNFKQDNIYKCKPTKIEGDVRIRKIDKTELEEISENVKIINITDESKISRAGKNNIIGALYPGCEVKDEKSCVIYNEGVNIKWILDVKT